MIDILTPELIILAYENGYFPMAEPESEAIYWHSPDPRAIIPLDHIRISRSLRQTINRSTYEVRFNTSFDRVIQYCARREETWISDEIIQAYNNLHEAGWAHSVETWHQDRLVGGLYGVAIGGAFFGESMFSLMANASKVAFATLTKRLRERGFVLLDSQYINDHMASLGAIEISRASYYQQLYHAVSIQCSFP